MMNVKKDNIYICKRYIICFRYKEIEVDRHTYKRCSYKSKGGQERAERYFCCVSQTMITKERGERGRWRGEVIF